MKVRIKKNVLFDGINKVSKAISIKNLIPTLAGIKFELNKKGLTLTASNNDITIQNFIPIKKDEIIIEKDGIVIIQGRDILEIVRVIPEEYINIELFDESKILIYTDDENIKYDLNIIALNQYPNILLEKSDNFIKMSIGDFLDLIRETAFAASDDDTRPVLTGINLDITKENLECVVTDSYRLTRKIIKLNDRVEENHNIIIPKKNILDFTKIISNSDEFVNLHIFNDKILLETENTLFQSRLIAGSYPQTSKSIPKEFNLVINVDRKQFYNIIEQASILNNDKDKNIVSINIKENMLYAQSISNEKGSAKMKMVIENNSKEEINISFSARFMMEALNALSTNTVEISLINEVKPIILKNNVEDNLLQLILPIRTY